MYEYYVRKVEKVVDGDTIDVLIDLGFDILFQSRVRLAGIDTPESRTKDLKEKALGLESKEYLSKHIKDAKSVVIKTDKMNSTEQFGRILGWIYVNGDLMFCGHHYNKIMDNSEAYAKMMAFMLTVIDERDKLIENKSKGKDY